MATITPMGSTAEGTILNNVVGIAALLAVIALVYFIARGRIMPPAGDMSKTERPMQQQMEPPPPVPFP